MLPILLFSLSGAQLLTSCSGTEEGSSHAVSQGSSSVVDQSSGSIAEQSFNPDQETSASGKKEGLSAYELYVEQFPGYTWGLEQWLRDLALGNLSVTISFDSNGGDPIEPLAFCKGEQVDIGVRATKAHASFVGWFSDDALTEEIQYSFVATTSKTVFAKYVYDAASVAFMDNGTIYQMVETNFCSLVEPPTSPSSLGFKFVGWKESGKTGFFDFAHPINQAETTLESVYDYEFFEIPAVVINTDDGSGITDKETYRHSTVSILNTEEEWTMTDVPAGVRGRGNSSWGMPKKPYRIKFDKKQSVLGSSYKSKSWTLIANYSDRTLARNYLAYEMGDKLDGIAYSSMHKFVDLYLNGEYLGVYLLCDQLQVGEGKVAIDESVAEDGDNGYFLEKDDRAPSEGGVEGQDWFYACGECYAFKSPDPESELFLQNKETQVAFITDYLTQCIDTILDKEKAWSEVESLIDVNSFVDSYVVDELFANNDCGHTSCYFHKDKGGKLVKGPLWDFDIAAGNINYNMGNADTCPYDAELWAANNFSWYDRLLKREEFVELVKQRLAGSKETLLEVISCADPASASSPLSLCPKAIQRNFVKWSINGAHIWPSPKEVNDIGSTEGHYAYLYQWLMGRYEYVWGQYFGSEVPFDGEPEPDAYKATFVCDDGIESITFYENSDYANSPTAVGTVGFSRDSVTGDYLKDGSGQVNFKITFKNGFSLDRIEIEGSYKNLKGPSDTAQSDMYRVTKVASDLTVSVYSLQNAQQP